MKKSQFCFEITCNSSNYTIRFKHNVIEKCSFAISLTIKWFSIDFHLEISNKTHPY